MPLLASSLTLGSLCGLASFDGTLWQALGWGLLALLSALWGSASPGESVPGAPSLGTSSHGRALCSALIGLSCAGALHGFSAGERLGPRARLEESASSRLDPEQPSSLEGRWQNLGQGPRGFVLGTGDQPPWDRIFEPAAGRVADGERVLLSPGEALVPWPAGPYPGPLARAGRFRGLQSVQPDELVVLARARPGPRALRNWFAGRLQALRLWTQGRTDELESRGQAHGLVRALVSGDRSGVSPACLDLFTRTGARHGLALSGLHVGLLSGLLLLPLSALLRRAPAGLFGGPLARELCILGIRLSLLLGFCLWVGARPPVVRAVCAVCLALIGPCLPGRFPGSLHSGRRADGLSVWSLALVLELLANPLAIQDLSLRLSYLATLGILLGTGPLMRGMGMQRPLFRQRFWNAGPWHWTQVLLQRLLRGLGYTLAASIAAVASTLPDVAAQFGEFSPTGVLFAPLVLPSIALLLLSAWISVLTSIPLWVPEQAELLVQLLGWIDRLPGTPLPLPFRPTLYYWGLWGLACLGLGGLGRVPVPKLRRAACLVAGLGLLPWSAAPSGLELHVIDVGHGTAAVLRAPGLPALIFDGGSLQRRGLYAEALAPLLARWEVTRPWVFLSHGDRDHHSGLPKLLERYPPARWMGALPPHLGERLAHGSEHLDLDSGLQELYWGAPGGPLSLQWMRALPLQDNEGSRSLGVTWRGQKLLLAGDAEGDGLRLMLSNSWLEGPLRLLLFPHHGSETPHLGALLAQSQPTEIWISAARERPPVALELERRGLRWSSTGASGSLALCLP